MKNNKGITLISLIVTIIVMLILAGIALVFAVGEEGIIKRAEESSSEMIAQSEKEILYNAVNGNLTEDGVKINS